MNTHKNNTKLDELIYGAIGRDAPRFDFDKWKQEHKEQIEIFQARKEQASTAFGPSIRRIILWRKVGYLAAALLLVASWIMCFVLSERVTDLKEELVQARRDIALARTDDSATINLYLKEHQDIIAQHASASPAAPQAQMRVSLRDVLYYEFLDDGPEYMRPGIIVRGPSSEQEIDSLGTPSLISNGHTLTLSGARKTADFELHAPARLYPGYSLEQIRRIEGHDGLQLLYTDGINSISLFEQLLDGQHGLSRQDFREYAVYQNAEQAGGTILAWRDEALSYVLIGNIEMSQLMDMAQSISAGK